MNFPKIRYSCTEAAPSFPVHFSKLRLGDGELLVLRDDRLPGGTKQRALTPFLLECAAEGYDSFAYASPFSGFAQVALSHTCKALRLGCHIFAEYDPSQPPGTRMAHPATTAAREAGAKVTMVPTLAEAERLADRWAAAAQRRQKIPLGLDCEGFRHHLGHEAGRIWTQVLASSKKIPRRVWVALGSGTLSTVLRSVIPPSTAIHCVDVHVLAAADQRIRRVGALAQTRVLSAPELFSQVADEQPIIPSNRYYDAKVWRFIAQHGEPGDLWWNVAR